MCVKEQQSAYKTLGLFQNLETDTKFLALENAATHGLFSCYWVIDVAKRMMQ